MEGPAAPRGGRAYTVLEGLSVAPRRPLSRALQDAAVILYGAPACERLGARQLVCPGDHAVSVNNTQPRPCELRECANSYLLLRRGVRRAPGASMCAGEGHTRRRTYLLSRFVPVARLSCRVARPAPCVRRRGRAPGAPPVWVGSRQARVGAPRARAGGGALRYRSPTEALTTACDVDPQRAVFPSTSRRTPNRQSPRVQRQSESPHRDTSLRDGCHMARVATCSLPE